MTSNIDSSLHEEIDANSSRRLRAIDRNKCPECDAAFVDVQQYLDHVQNAHNASKVFCTYCRTYVSRTSKPKHEQSKAHMKNVDLALVREQEQHDPKRRRVDDQDDEPLPGGGNDDDDGGTVAPSYDDDGMLEPRGDDDGAVAGDEAGAARVSAGFSSPPDNVAVDAHVAQFFATCSASPQSVVAPMPYDESKVFTTSGARPVLLTTPEQQAVNSSATLDIGLLVKHRTTRDFGNELLAMLHTLDSTIASSLEMAHKVAQSRVGVVAVQRIGEYSCRDPIDVIIEILRTLRRDGISETSFQYDSSKSDRVLSRRNYKRFSDYFSLVTQKGFSLVLVDVYFDAYEYVKAKKRCAGRLRVTGDVSGEWHDIVEIENAQLLSREELIRKQNEVIETILAPALERLSHGVVVAHNGVVEFRIVGSLYQIVGDMQLRQEILGLRNFVAPMLPPLVNIDIDTISQQRRTRSLVAQAALFKWALPRLQQRGDIGVAREVLRVAGCNYAGSSIDQPALLRLPVFDFWRTIGAELIAPDPLHQHPGIATHMIKRLLTLVDEPTLTRVNDAAKNYPRHPNLIHQNRIVNSYTSRQTKRHAVALNALNSQEIDHLMRIMPEVLLYAGIPPAYITPFVIYLQYLEQLKRSITIRPTHNMTKFVICCDV